MREPRGREWQKDGRGCPRQHEPRHDQMRGVHSRRDGLIQAIGTGACSRLRLAGNQPVGQSGRFQVTWMLNANQALAA